MLLFVLMLTGTGDQRNRQTKPCEKDYIFYSEGRDVEAPFRRETTIRKLIK